MGVVAGVVFSGAMADVSRVQRMAEAPPMETAPNRTIQIMMRFMQL